MFIFASDMDGTLVFNNKISRDDAEEILHFQKAGHKFGLCTGRVLARALDIPDFLKPDFIIASSGACILDQDKKIIYKRIIPFEIAKDIFDKFKDSMKMVIHTSDWKKIFAVNLQPIYDHELVMLESFDSMKNQDIYGISIIFQTEQMAEGVAEEIENEYQSLNAFVNKNSIDVVNNDCSKGNGIEMIKSLYENPVIAAIGDSYNDLSMFAVADQSFTFKYSPPEVKRKAKKIVRNVAQAIQTILKNE